MSGAGTKESDYGMCMIMKPGEQIGVWLAGAGNSYFNGTGNVLIGKTTQANTAYKLDVAGSVRANEVVVNTTGADFVFDKNYKLLPIDSLHAYLTKNKHLPGIASAKEMQTHGQSVGEMNTQLLQKVEELTLYIVQQQQAMVDMKKQIEDLKNK